jgi:hypothetical protein
VYVNQIYDPNHVISYWFPYKSDISAHGWDKCICRWVWFFAQLECFDVTGNKFWHVAHTKNFENRQPPLFRFPMAERRSQRGQPNSRGRPEGHRATCINLDLHDNERRWKWKRSKLLVSFNTVVWATLQNMFLDLPKQPSCAKLQTQRQMHSPQWRIRMKRKFEVLRSFFLTRARRCHFCMGIS